jgi:hypothetical protein
MAKMPYVDRGSRRQILSAPALQGDVESAREAMRQKLLVGLSSAYAINAIVQTPDSVTANLPTGSGQRLSGKPLSTGYTTGAADGFTQVASAYQVSPALGAGVQY